MSEAFEPGTVGIVTGGTRGIGRSVTERLASEGVSVVATYHSDETAAAETAEALAAFDQPTGVEQFDVADHGAVESAVERIADEYGQPSVLVNNAGIMRNGLSLRLSPAEWASVIETNLTGSFNCTKAVVSRMVRGSGGAIVNVASVGALHGFAGQANYAASKAGMVGMTRSLARELGGREIRINAVCPGYTATSLLGSSELADREQILAEEDIPQDRIATPAEVAEPIVFLASQRASYVNGAVLRVDGGMLA